MRPRHPAFGLRLELLETGKYYDRFIFEFDTYCEFMGDYRVVRGDLYRTRPALEQPRPLVLVSPILAGPVDDYFASRLVCSAAGKRGFSAFFLHQQKVIFDPERDTVSLEAWVRSNVRDNRKALDLLGALPWVDARRMGSVGISLGGIKNVLLVGAEPRLGSNAIVIAGCDLAEMVDTSREALVLRYIEGRRDLDHVSKPELRSEVARWLVSEPATWAPHVDSSRILQFWGRYDNKVPVANCVGLWELLGRPEAHILPTGHYTIIPFAPWVVGRLLDWLEGRWAGDLVGVARK